jgi:hypothetical protein
MKTKIKYLLTSFSLLFFFSCTDLGEDVYDKIPADKFGQTEAQINAIIAPIYRSLTSLWPGDGLVISEELHIWLEGPDSKQDAIGGWLFIWNSSDILGEPRSGVFYDFRNMRLGVLAPAIKNWQL